MGQKIFKPVSCHFLTSPPCWSFLLFEAWVTILDPPECWSHFSVAYDLVVIPHSMVIYLFGYMNACHSSWFWRKSGFQMLRKQQKLDLTGTMGQTSGTIWVAGTPGLPGPPPSADATPSTYWTTCKQRKMLHGFEVAVSLGSFHCEDKRRQTSDTSQKGENDQL